MVGRELYNVDMLTIEDHRRDSAGLRYVYPVVSRRAGGVSVGINLNVNNACNWACVYCQVEGLVRGGPPPVDLALLETELSGFIEEALHGDFMVREVPEGARRLMDVAFSGNGEPTSAPEFADAVSRVGGVLERHGLAGRLPLRVITNGSLLHRPEVRRGIELIAGYGGEVWFKFDRAPDLEAAAVNGVPLDPARAVRNLAACAGLAPTWVQTCWFAMDGQAPDTGSRAAYCAALRPLAGRLAGVHLYGLARPSLQPGAGRLSRMSETELAAFAAQITQETGLAVTVSP
jgi:pyruvate-formate lyase-activating enzyme